jgi:diacylglycerol O-acyltransferase / wax synthase
VFSQPLDRDKPLWEMWLVEGLEPGPNGPQFAILSKTHHALVDGISGVDIATVLFDASPERSEQTEPPPRWVPSPEPSRNQLLAEALVERATVPAEVVRSIRAVMRGPRQIMRAATDSAVGIGAMAWAGLRPPPQSPYSTDLGPHRRYAWTMVSLGDVKAIKNELGGTVNDVVLAGVAGAIGRHLQRRGADDGVRTLRAMVPVSVRSTDERGHLCNRVTAMMAPLPVAERDPRARLKIVSDAMAGIKRSGQAVGAQVLTELTGFAPPTLMAQGSRLISTARFFNLVVTNVPGPQFPLYLLGRELREIYPMVPLARGQALGIAIMSYNGRMGFGLLGDWDAMTDLDDLAGDLHDSLAELAQAAGVKLGGTPEPAPSDPRPRKHVAT